MRIRITAAFIGTLLTGLCWGQDSPTPVVSAGWTEEQPEIDGTVKDAVWMKAAVATNFIQQDPDFGAPASEKTEVRVLLDKQKIYFGIVCFDSDPKRILVTQSRRDGDLKDDDSIQIVLDTFNDNQNGYVFGTNPSGVKYDGQVTKEGRTGGFTSMASGTAGRSLASQQRGAIGGFNLNWDGTWEVTSKITERGWEAEIAIPLSTLRYQGKGDTWGLNILRIIRRKNELSFWSPIPRSFNLHKVSLAGSLVDMQLTDNRTFDLKPYLLAGVQEQAGVPEDSSWYHVAEVGMDVKYSLTPSMNLDLTYNTDFAQVETDDEQVNLTRFNLFFPEKRPFFLENAGFFQFGTPQETELFFSRRIGLDSSGETIPIFGGARIAGKAGRYSLGILDMQTEEVEGVAPSNNFFVLRMNRELKTRSSMGVIFVNRQAMTSGKESDYNRTFGVDANLGFGRDLTLYSYLAKTLTPGLQGDDLAARVYMDYNTDLWIVRGGYSEVQKNFNPEVGFVRRTGYRRPEINIHFTPRPENSLIRKHDPHGSLARHYGTDGVLESEFLHLDYGLEFQSGGRTGVAFNRRYELIRQPFEVVPTTFVPPGGYTWNEFSLRYSTNPSAALFTNARYTRGGFYGGHRNNLRLLWGARTSEKFLMQLQYDLNDGSTVGRDFRLHLASLRLSYSFTPQSLLQGLIQYNSRFNTFSSYIQFSLIRQANTGLFIVYTEERETMHGEFSPLGRALLLKYSHRIGL